MTLIVGQKLWFVPIGRRRENVDGHYVEVSTIGRKWAHLSADGRPYARVDRNTLKTEYMPSRSVEGRAFTSKAEWQQCEQAQEAWVDLCRIMTTHAMPRHLTAAKIAEIKRTVTGEEPRETP